MGMNNNQNGHRPNKTEHNNKHIESKVEVSPETTRAFFALLQFFRLRIDESKSLNGFRSETVNEIADSVFKETISNGFCAPEYPAKFRKAEKAIREAMDKAKADVFNLEFVEGLHIVPKGKDKDFVEANLQFREVLEQKYREETGFCPTCARLREECGEPHKQRA